MDGIDWNTIHFFIDDLVLQISSEVHQTNKDIDEVTTGADALTVA